MKYMMVGRVLDKRIWAGMLLAVLAGCAVTQPQAVPRDVYHIHDPEFNRNYFVYLPSSYGKRPLPLVVTCHGTNPWDNARMQINEWKYLAEHSEFVVVAPEVESARGFLPPGPAQGIAILEEDEKFILKLFERFRNNVNIDRRATMITGWSAGGFAAYFIGLRHPEIFRVIAARQANFIREYYTPEIGPFDPWQPILIFYGQGDLPLLKADSKVAYTFLGKAGQKNLFIKSLNVGHSRHPEVALDFFATAVKKYPWPVVRQTKFPADGRCRVVFDSGLIGLTGTERICWDFGDGGTAEGGAVEHVYAGPGTYKLVVTHDDNGQLIRHDSRVKIEAKTLSITPGDKE